MIENVSTQLTVFHCFAHCLLPGMAFASLYALLFLEKEAEIGGRALINREAKCLIHNCIPERLFFSFLFLFYLNNDSQCSGITKRHNIIALNLKKKKNEKRYTHWQS